MQKLLFEVFPLLQDPFSNVSTQAEGNPDQKTQINQKHRCDETLHPSPSSCSGHLIDETYCVSGCEKSSHMMPSAWNVDIFTRTAVLFHKLKANRVHD